MKFRVLASCFFLVYGALITLLAGDFAAEAPAATLAMIASCIVIAALLWSGRAFLMNVVIAGYLWRLYLTRPFVNVFAGGLGSVQRNYIDSNDYFFNAHDAKVVYFSLLSLLVAWFLGLHAVSPKPDQEAPLPWLLRRVDEIITANNWRFWFVWLLLSLLNYRSPTENWQVLATGTGVPLFALGLFATATIDIVCFYAFLRSRQAHARPASYLLLLPVVVAAVRGTVGGSRSAIFASASLGFSYWLFLQAERQFLRRHVWKAALASLIFPVIVVAALFANLLRPLLRVTGDKAVIMDAISRNLNFQNPNNPLVEALSFGLTQLLHRFSALQAQFLILNDHWIHDPSDTYNPLYIFMRIVNSLLPGSLKPFGNLLNINQLFDYIYFDARATYSSAMWSIQGSAYLLFGFWCSAIVVFAIGCVVGRYYERLEGMAKASPAFAAVFVIFVGEFIENGTLERVIVGDIVRPITGFLALIFLLRASRVLVPTRRPPGSSNANREQPS